jgi:DNA polymerase-1
VSRVLVAADFSYLAHRANAIFGERFTAPDGRPTGVAYGVLAGILGVADARGATDIVVALEAGGTRARREIDPGYKGNRVPTTPAADAGFAIAREAVAAMGWPALRAQGWEADDALAAMVREARAAGFSHTVVLTADRDLWALAADDVTISATADTPPVGPAEVRARFGVEPWQVPHYKAIAGDSSDGYAGVPGLGPKAATALVAAHGDIDGIYAAIGSVAPARARELLITHQAAARRCLDIATLRAGAPLDPDFAPAPVRPADPAAARAWLERAGLRSLAARLGR